MKKSAVLRFIKTIATRLVLVLFGVALSWLVLEVLLRVGFDYLPPKAQADIQDVQLVPWSPSQIIPHIPWVGDNDFQLRVPPGLTDFPVHWSDARFTFSTISAWEGHRAGFRSNPPQWPLDVLTFGDSFTFCWTKLEDCWVHQLGANYNWHVFDAGVPGTGVTGQLNMMKEIAPPFKPALVIWQWYSNDVTDDYDLARIRNETPELGGSPMPPAEPEPQGLGQYSAVYQLLSVIFNPPKNTSPYKHTQAVTVNGRTMFIHTNEYPFNNGLAWQQNLYGWKSNVQSHLAGAQLLQNQGAKMLLVVIPTKEEAYAAYLGQALGQDWLTQTGETRRRLLQQCTNEGWYCVDPLPAFQDAIKNGQTIYYAYDQHLDPSGNKLLATLVHDYIIKNGLLLNKS